ncbi:MAG TPA: serine protease, partial [Streptomyces sp.]
AGDPAATTPEHAARLAREAGRPLLVVLDAPEEMPPALAHRLPDWTRATEHWLRAHAARLTPGCRPEHWEQAAELYGRGARAVLLGPLDEPDARALRERYGIGEGVLAPADARHPLALRLLAEVRAALPGDVAGRPGREEIFTAHLDLMCLRIAVRIAAGSRPLLRGTAVRRLAARVAGQVHEAARRCLGPGQGELDRESFEDLFPWRDGWASAVLTEGLLAPAGTGYRFAHEELADWLQGAHLDLDTALHSLIHRYDGDVRPDPQPSSSHPVPRHRIGPVLQALLLVDRVQGPAALAGRLGDLLDAVERLAGAEPGGDAEGGDPWDPAARVEDARWWAGRLVRDALLRVPNPRAYLGVLRELADRIGTGGVAPEAFAPGFWTRLRLAEDERIDLLRRLVPADRDGWDGDRDGRDRGRRVPGGDPEVWDQDRRDQQVGEVWERSGRDRGRRDQVRPDQCRDRDGDRRDGDRPVRGGELDSRDRYGDRHGQDQYRDHRPRYLDAVAERLVADPRGVQPLLCRWFADERPLPAAPGATVAAAAQALLYARRDLAVDDLCEALVATAHPRADELLAALAEDEPAALCRAVDRWAHDDGRPARRVAAAAYGRLV